MTADKNFHDSWFYSWFAILQWNLSGDHSVEQLYLLNITFSCQSLVLLLLVRLVAQSRRISAFTLKSLSKYYPSLFLWLIIVHESRHERPISIQFYTTLRLNFIWKHSFRWMWESYSSWNCFSGGWLLYLASIVFSVFQVLPSCNTSVFYWGKFQRNQVTSQFDGHNVLYLILI